jgi:hypothetical protein
MAALKLAQEFFPEELNKSTKDFMTHLEKAKSNIRDFGDAKEIFKRFVFPTMYAFRKAANQYLLGRIFLKDDEIPPQPLHDIEMLETFFSLEEKQKHPSECGLVEIKHKRTLEKRL